MVEGAKKDAVLLPTARIDVFADAEDTQKIMKQLREDWRFARVKIDVESNGIDAAIDRYAEYSSPDLVIIGTDDISSTFIDKLGVLAGHCIEGTEAVIIGPENDVQLYRQLVGMGVRDYLVRPIESEDMVGVIAHALFEKKGISESRLIAVVGAMGGMGTTSIAQMLAWDIAEELKQKTMLMDAAGGWSTLGVSLGIDPTATLAECIKNAVDGTEEDVERIFSEVTQNLTVFACGGDDMIHYAVDGDQYEKAVDRIMKTFPVVVVDLSCAPADVRHRIIERAHDILIVTTTGLTALRSARSLLTEVKALRGEKNEVIDLVVNKKGQFGAKEISEADIETALEHKPEAYIPYLPDVFTETEATGKPLAEAKGGSDVTMRLLNVAEHASGYEKSSQKKSDKAEGSVLDKLLAGFKAKG
jgi:pilus assembly protein CpaE